jgi:TP901 family phage tail tape measure protein
VANVIANINVNVHTAKAAANIAALQSQVNRLAAQPLFSPQHIAQQKAFNNALAQSAISSKQFTASIRPMLSGVDQFNKNLDRGAFSMSQYARYSAAATTSLGKFFRAEQKIIQDAAKSRVAQLATQYTSLGGAVGSANKALALTPTHLNSMAASQQMAIERQRILNTLLRQGNTRLLNWGKNTQWAGRQLMVGFTVPLTIFAGLAAKTFSDLEKQAVAFKKVYGDIFTTDQEVEKNLEAIKELSKEFTKYGIAVKDTMELATLAAQSGQRGAELMAATTEATRLSVLGQMEAQDAMQTTISLQTAFKLSNEELAESVNFLNSVENQSVLSLQDVSRAIPIVAPVISSLGGSVEDLAAMLVAMKEGGVTAGEGANALKTSLSRLISPTKAAKDMARGFGIDLEELVGRNAGQVLPMITELAERMKNLGGVAQQQLLSEVFGKRQYARIGALFQNITRDGSQAQRVIGLTELSVKELADTAEKELSAVEEAFSTKLSRTFEMLKVEIAPIGEAFIKAITPLVKAATKVFEFFNNLPEGIKNFTLLGLAITAIGGPVVMMIGLFANGLAQTLKFIHGLFALRARLMGAGAGFKEMTAAERDAFAATNSLGGATDSLRTKMLLNTTATNALARSYGALATQAAAAAAAMGRVPVGVALPGAAGRAAGAAARMRTQTLNAGGDVQAQKAFATKPIFTSPTANTVPGVGNTDTVPAMLTPGEFVVNKKATKENLEILRAINSGKPIGLNKGGRVPGMQYFNRFMMQRIVQPMTAKPKVEPTTIWHRGNLEELQVKPPQTASMNRHTMGPATYGDVNAERTAKWGKQGDLLYKITTKKPMVNMEENFFASNAMQSILPKWADNLKKNMGMDIEKYLPWKSSGFASKLSKFRKKDKDFTVAEVQAVVATEIAENVARRFGLSRRSKDFIDLESQINAQFRQAVIDSGYGGGRIGSIVALYDTSSAQIQRVAAGPMLKPSIGLNAGNIVPGVGNTDTVPAMLTPGEFVVNKQSTRQFRPLLESINSGNVAGYNAGGGIPTPKPSQSTGMIQALMSGGMIPRYMAGTNDPIPQSNRYKEEFLHQGPRRLATAEEVAAIQRHSQDKRILAALGRGETPYLYSNLGVLGPGAFQAGATGAQMSGLFTGSNVDRTMMPFYRAYAQAITGKSELSPRDIKSIMNNPEVQKSVRATSAALATAYGSYGTTALSEAKQYSVMQGVLQQRSATDPALQRALPFMTTMTTVGVSDPNAKGGTHRGKLPADAQRELGRTPVTSYKSWATQERIAKVMGAPAVVVPQGVPQAAATSQPAPAAPLPAAPSARPKGEKPPPGSLKRDAAKIARQMVRSGYTHQEVSSRMQKIGFTPQQSERIATSQFERNTPRTLKEIVQSNRAKEERQQSRNEQKPRRKSLRQRVEEGRASRAASPQSVSASQLRPLAFTPGVDRGVRTPLAQRIIERRTAEALAAQRQTAQAEQARTLANLRGAARAPLPFAPGLLGTAITPGASSPYGLMTAADPRFGRSPSAPGSQMYAISQASLDQRPSSVRFGLAPQGAGRLRRGFARATRPIRGAGNAGLGLMQRLAYGTGGGLARENLGLANARDRGGAVLSSGRILGEATRQIGSNMMMLSRDMSQALRSGDVRSAGTMFANAARSAAKASVANTKFAANVQNAATRVSNFGRFMKELVTPGYARAFGPDNRAGGAGAAGGGGFFGNMFGRGGGPGGPGRVGGGGYGPALPAAPSLFRSGMVYDPNAGPGATGSYVSQQSKLATGVQKFGGAAGMAMMMGSMLPMMMQDEEGKFAGMPAQTAMMGMMGGGMLLSLAPTFGAAAPAVLGLAAAAAAAGIAIYKWRDNVDTAARKAAELGSNLGGTANAVNKMAKLMNLETPAQRQTDLRLGYSEEEKMEDFGEFGQYLGNEQGQKFIDELKAMTSDQRFQALGDYLRSAVATGMMDKDQAQSFGRVVASAIGDGLLGVRVFKDLATQKAGMEGMLSIAEQRLSAVEASSQIAQVEAGGAVGYGEASFAIGSSLQVMQDFSNVAALAREEFDKGTISFEEMRSAVNKATEVQNRYSDVIFNALGNASDGGAVRQAYREELIRTGLVTEEQYSSAMEAFRGDRAYEAVRSQVLGESQTRADESGLGWLRDFAAFGRGETEAEAERITQAMETVPQQLETLYAALLTSGRDPIMAQEVALSSVADPQISRLYNSIFAQEDVGRVEALESAYLIAQREGSMAVRAQEVAEKALAQGATEEQARAKGQEFIYQEVAATRAQKRYVADAEGTVADFQIFEELLPDDQKMAILKQTANMTDEQFNKFVADYIELNGIVKDTDVGALVAQSEAYRDALAGGRGDEFVSSVGAAKETFGDDFESVFRFVIDSNVPNPGEYLDYITETANRFKTEIPSDVTAQLGINLVGPQAGEDMAKWGPIIDQLVEFMPAIREMPEGSLERNIAIGLMTTYDEDGTPRSEDPDVWATKVRAAQKEVDKLSSDKKEVRKEAILSLLQKVENDKGETLTPEEALQARTELFDQFGEGKVLNLPPDVISKMVEIQAEIAGLENYISILEAQRAVLLSGATDAVSRSAANKITDEINGLRATAAMLGSDLRAEFNVGRTQRTGGSTGSSGSSGGGAKQNTPVENLQEALDEQLKLWGGVNVKIENLNKLKQDSIYKTIKGDSIFNKLKNVKGIGPSMLENILGMGSEGAQEFINKYIKNGKLTQAGEAFLGAQALGATRQTIGEAVLSRRQSRQQRNAANTLRSEGRSEELIQQIAGDPKRAELYNKLVQDSKNGIAGATKELNKFIRAQQRQVDLAKEAAEAMQSPFDRAIQDQQKYFDKQSAFFDKAYADIEMLAHQEFKVRTGMTVEAMEIEIMKNQDLIDSYEDRIRVIQDEIRAIETRSGGLEDLQNEIRANQDIIQALERQNELAQRRIDILSRQDEMRMRESEKIEKDLEQLSIAEDEIRSAYEKRIEALDKVASVNDYIIDQQKQQLNLSRAISEGDIYAATQAAQEMRASSATFSVDQARQGLETGMENQIEGLRTEGGLTRVQAEEKIRQIQEQSYQTSLQIREIEDEIYNRQINDILPLKDREYQLNLSLESVQREIEAKQREIRDIERSKIEPIERQNALYREQIDDLLDGIQIEQSKVTNEVGQSRSEMERMNSWVMATLTNNELMTQETTRAEQKAADLAAQWQNVAKQINSAKRALADRYNKIDLKPLGAKYTEEDREAERSAAWEAYNARIQELLSTIPNMTPAMMGFENNYAGGFISGTGTRDSVPSFLTPGEFVIKKAMVDKYGTPFFQAINQGAFNMPRYSLPETNGSTVIAPMTNMTNVNAPVYNTYDMKFSINGTNQNADDIANQVMFKMRQLQNQNVRGNRGY